MGGNAQHPRTFTRAAVCRFNSVFLYSQSSTRAVAYPSSVAVVLTARAVPPGGQRYYSSSTKAASQKYHVGERQQQEAVDRYLVIMTRNSSNSQLTDVLEIDISNTVVPGTKYVYCRSTDLQQKGAVSKYCTYKKVTVGTRYV